MHAQQLGVKAESTYGTPVVVDRFFEYVSESMKLDMARTRSAGLRSGQRIGRTDRFLPYRKGASGSVTMEVPTKGFGFWLKQATGSPDAVSAAVDSNYTQTHIIATLLADMFTMQFNRQTTDEANQAFTYHGCKVLAMELSIEPEGILMGTFELDAEDEDTSTGLASVSYTSDYRVFAWQNAAVTIATVAVPMTSYKLRIENPLNVDRRLISGSALKLQPLENADRLVTVTMGLEFTSTTQYARFQSATAAGALAAVEATFDGDVAHAGTTVPRLVVTTPKVDFEAVDGLVAADKDRIAYTISGTALYDGSSEALTITYRTTDAAV